MIDQDAPGRHHLLMPEAKLLDERSVGRQVASLEVRQQAGAGYPTILSSPRRL